MKYIVVGDVHGHYTQLVDLFQKSKKHVNLDNYPEEYRWIFLGDIVDGGDNSSAVITTVKRMVDGVGAICLRGNHEDMLLDAMKNRHDLSTYNHWHYQGGQATLKSYSKNLTPYEESIGGAYAKLELDIPFIESLPYYYQTESFIFVHAGLVPGVDVENTNSTDLTWIRDEFIKSEYDWGKRVIFGHTCRTIPLVMPNKIGIDTMNHETGYLTAVLLDDDRPEWYEFIHSIRT